jgi:hypothetical protein
MNPNQNPLAQLSPKARSRILAARLRLDGEYRECAVTRFRSPILGGTTFDWESAGTWLVSAELEAIFREVQAHESMTPEDALQTLMGSLDDALDRYNQDHSQWYFVPRRGVQYVDTRETIRPRIMASELWQEIVAWLLALAEESASKRSSEEVAPVKSPSGTPSEGRRHGFGANADGHVTVAAAAARFADDWKNHLGDICLELHEHGVLFPKKTYEKDSIKSWRALSDEVEGRGTAENREKLLKYIRYRIDWVQKNRA